MKRKAWKPKKEFAKLRARSKRLEFRPYTLRDFEAWRAGHAGRKPKQHQFDEPNVRLSQLTPKFFRERVRAHQRGARAGKSFTFGIFERSTGRVLGFIGYYLISESMRWANLGYSVHNQFWGQGIGPEAARLVLELGFGALDFHRIEASCEPGNKASAKVARRAGLRFEGLRKKFFAHKGGVDLIVFAENQIDYRKKRRP